MFAFLALICCFCLPIVHTNLEARITKTVMTAFSLLAGAVEAGVRLTQAPGHLAQRS
jgi:hypothetical protein